MKRNLLLNNLLFAMIKYYEGDPKRIQHFIKVHSFAKLIGESENLDDKTMFILEAAAIVHDIGIKPAEEKYGKCDGKLQEQEGPAVAEKMLRSLGFSALDIERISYLVGHHHTYQSIDGIDYQILIEADFLVNLYEDMSGKSACQNAYDRIFVAASGRQICRQMFSL